MIPIIDIAKLISRQNVTVSIITTPKNAARFRPTVDRSGYPIRLLQVRFPSVEAGLPEGCENLDALPSLDLAANFFVALNLLQEDVGKLFDEMSPPPSCLISDMGLPWTSQIAQRFDIPRIVFHGTCCFSLLCSNNIRASNVLDTLESEMDEFEVPNIPHKIRLRKSQVLRKKERSYTHLLFVYFVRLIEFCSDVRNLVIYLYIHINVVEVERCGI